MLGAPEINISNDFWLRPVGFDKECTGCLIGAVLFSVGVRNSIGILFLEEFLIERWPWIKNVAAGDYCCPSCRYYCIFPDILAFATHLVSHYLSVVGYSKMTLEQIADIFGAIEDKYDPPIQELVSEVEIEQWECV